MIDINSATLSFDLDNGDTFTFDLSPTQLAIVCKILGCKFNSDSTVTCFSDNTLTQLFNMKGNPLKLREG